MWLVLHLAIRGSVLLLGAFFIVTATLLYPAEDGKIQSRLEDLWVEVDDFQSAVISKHADFMARVARFETRRLDLVFGHKLLSEQSLIVSLSFSLISATIVSYFADKMIQALADLAFSGPGETTIVSNVTIKGQLYANRYLVVIALLGLAVGLVAIALRQSRPAARRSALAGLLVLIIVTCFLGHETLSLYFVILIAVPSFLCDALFIAATRSLLRVAGSMKSPIKVAATVTATVILASLLVSPYFLAEHASLNDLGYVLAFGIAYSNVVDLVLASAFFVLCLILLLHMALWPVLTRTLFRIADIGTKGRRGILAGVGSALITAAVHHRPGDLIMHLVKHIP